MSGACSASIKCPAIRKSAICWIRSHSAHPGRLVDRHAGRNRWKIENENNNVFKNQGYYLERNYGQGQQYLAAVVVQLILLAFLFHTVLRL